MTRARRRTLLALATGVVAAAGCGAAERQRDSTSASTSDRVEVVLRPRGGEGQQLRKTVSCTTVNALCRRLRTADFSAPSGDEVCMANYGGPATATVTGKAGGRAVDATFDLRDGCAIGRWERFAWLLGDPPGTG